MMLPSQTVITHKKKPKETVNDILAYLKSQSVARRFEFCNLESLTGRPLGLLYYSSFRSQTSQIYIELPP